MARGKFLSKKGYEKLFKELEKLKKRRPELSKMIAEAREKGDLSENADYDAAKEAQGMNEKRIAELQMTLGSARLIENENIAADEALIGATVHLKNLDNGDKIVYTLVSGEEADFASGRISVESPVGDGLLGHKAGDEVQITVPAGTLRYKLEKITRE